MTFRNVLSAASAMLLALPLPISFASPVAAQSGRAARYVVPGDRPDVVGETSRFESEQRTTQSLERREGQTWVSVQTSELVVAMRGVRHTLAVNTVGSTTVEDVTVEALTVRRDGVESHPLATGTVLHVEHGTAAADAHTDTVIRIDGAPVDDALLEALTAVVGDEASETDDGAILGSGSSRRVGESWSVDEARFHDGMLRESGVDAAVRGNVRLDSVDTRSGHPYLTLSMDLAGVIRDIPLPPGTTFRSGSMALTGRHTVGSAAAAPEKASESTMDFEAEFSVRPRGAQANVVMRMHRHSTSTERSTRSTPEP